MNVLLLFEAILSSSTFVFYPVWSRGDKNEENECTVCLWCEVTNIIILLFLFVPWLVFYFISVNSLNKLVGDLTWALYLSDILAG